MVDIWLKLHLSETLNVIDHNGKQYVQYKYKYKYDYKYKYKSKCYAVKLA